MSKERASYANEGFSHGTIKSVIERFQSPAPPLTQNDRDLGIVRKLRKKLQKQNMESYPGNLSEMCEREDRFNHAVLIELGPDFPRTASRREDRIKLSDLISLYYLLVGGKLDALYEEWKIRTGASALGAQETLDIKGDLVLDFLQSMHRKNAETRRLSRTNSPITYGMELEYDDPIIARLNDYITLKNTLKANGVRIKDNQAVYSIGKYKRLSQRKNLDLEYFQLLAKAFFGSAIPDDKTYIQTSRAIKTDANVFSAMKNFPISPIEQDFDGSGYEVRTHPSASYKMQFREILYMHLSGGLSSESDWNFHFTIGGIDLLPNHTEIMDVLLISAAAGYSCNNIADGSPPSDTQNQESIREQDKKGSLIFHSATEGNLYYFPFHYRRRNLLTPYPLETTSGQGVEMRSAFTYKITEFPLFIRHVHFTGCAAHAIAAIQGKIKEHARINMLRAWNRLITGWTNLLREHGIQTLQPCDYYRHITGHAEPIIPYETMLTKVIDLSRSNGSFRKKSRKIIRTFTAAISPIIAQGII